MFSMNTDIAYALIPHENWEIKKKGEEHEPT